MPKLDLPYLKTKKNFLAIADEKYFAYDKAKFVIQSAPYEHTSSYLAGSDKGPGAILSASHFVELYDEELDQESYKKGGICTMKPMHFKGRTDKDAVDYIESETEKLLKDKKFVISLGAEHTVTAGFVKPFLKRHKELTVLQIDAHSDLRDTYNDNKYSHACVMHRLHDMGIHLVQVGIRAQCIEEAQLIKKSKNINTFYAHYIRENANWINDVVNNLDTDVYITIDADGFDPTVIPGVGTAEPNGLSYMEGVNLLRQVIKRKNVVGFDVVECAPRKDSIISEYTLAKLIYKMIGYITIKK